jgi:recombination protein RecT
VATATEQQQQQTRGGRQDKEALKKSNLDTLRKMFAQMEAQLRSALPSFLTAERMIRVATTTVQRVPLLLECHPVTVIGAVMQSAQLGLEPDNITGQAYLVPFWNSKNNRRECNLIPGYRGLMSLARRSKQIAAFDARVVKQGDIFEFEYGSNQFLRHKPALAMAAKDGKYVLEQKEEPPTVGAYMIAFYAGARSSDGRTPCQFHVMMRPDLEKAKQTTKSRDRNENIVGPWIEHPDAMFTKTVIRRGAKLLPFSVELDTAVALEDRHLAGRTQNLGVLGAEVLGMDFQAADDEGPEGGDGEGEGTIDPELVKRLDAGFTALQFSEARKTTKMQEYRGRLPELLQWLEAETLKNAKPAGEGSSTAAAASSEKNEPARPTNGGAGNGGGEPAQKPRASGKFRI